MACGLLSTSPAVTLQEYTVTQWKMPLSLRLLDNLLNRQFEDFIMARKTPKVIIEMINRYEDVVKQLGLIQDTRENIPEENWNDTTRKFTPEYAEGYLEAYWQATVSAIHAANCYHGFTYADSKGRMIRIADCPDREVQRHPEYNPNRVLFSVRI